MGDAPLPYETCIELYEDNYIYIVALVLSVRVVLCKKNLVFSMS